MPKVEGSGTWVVPAFWLIQTIWEEMRVAALNSPKAPITPMVGGANVALKDVIPATRPARKLGPPESPGAKVTSLGTPELVRPRPGK